MGSGTPHLRLVGDDGEPVQRSPGPGCAGCPRLAAQQRRVEELLDALVEAVEITLRGLDRFDGDGY